MDPKDYYEENGWGEWLVGLGYHETKGEVSYEANVVCTAREWSVGTLEKIILQ